MGRKPKRSDQHYGQATVSTSVWGFTLTKPEAEQVLRRAVANLAEIDRERSFVMGVKAYTNGKPSFVLVLSVRLPQGIGAGSHTAPAIVKTNVDYVEAIIRDMFPNKFASNVRRAAPVRR